MKYEWILFDADETLFSFDAFAGLTKVFADLGVEFSEDDYAEYQKINKPLWVQYQNGEITSLDLQTQRFSKWASQLAVSELLLNQQYQNAMASICQPFDGVKNSLASFKEKTKLGIITNGFSQLQQARLEKTGLEGYFEFVLVSEEVGAAKPDKKIFEHAYTMMGSPDKSRVLMVGDNLDTDILGAIQFGFDTCWINWHAQELVKNIKPTFEIDAFDKLEKMLTHS